MKITSALYKYYYYYYKAAYDKITTKPLFATILSN